MPFKKNSTIVIEDTRTLEDRIIKLFMKNAIMNRSIQPVSAETFLIPKIFFGKPIVAGFLGKPQDWKPTATLKNKIDTKNILKFSRPLQIHSKIVFEASETEQEGDGVWTTQENFVCTTRFADCIGGLFYHQKTGEIAAIHAGWRGLAQKIFSEYLQKFSDPEEIIVALSPSLGVCCAEFSDPFAETPHFFHPFIQKRSQKFFVDLWKIAKNELMENGILENNIEMPTICTHCEGKNKWWSFRNGEEERNVGYIWKIPHP